MFFAFTKSDLHFLNLRKRSIGAWPKASGENNSNNKTETTDVIIHSRYFAVSDWLQSHG